MPSIGSRVAAQAVDRPGHDHIKLAPLRILEHLVADRSAGHDPDAGGLRRGPVPRIDPAMEKRIQAPTELRALCDRAFKASVDALPDHET